MDQSRVLILGGTGFIGRNLAVYLVEGNRCAHVRVADKAMPQMTYFNERQKKAFENVEFVQANLAREASVEKAFKSDDGTFDVVINCAGMTTYGQGEAVYQEHVYDLGMKCAREAAKTGVKRWIEVSTAQVYAADKKPSDESGKTKPWTDLAAMRLRLETDLASIDGLNYTVVRPAIVYGESDRGGLMPRLIVGAVYKHLGEKMELLWTEKLRLNTVHVEDVAAALWLLAECGAPGEVYNLVDEADSSQKSITNLVCELFGISSGYVGTIKSNMAKLVMNQVVSDINEKHMAPWSVMCSEANVTNTPLGPYLDKELLYNNSLSVSNEKIKAAGFAFAHPTPTVENLRAVVQGYIDQKLFPEGFLV